MNQVSGMNTIMVSPPREEGKGEVAIDVGDTLEEKLSIQQHQLRPPHTPPHEGEKLHTSVIPTGIILASIFVFAVVVRWHNLFAYNTWWADDGGAHVAYIQKILEFGRLPTTAETYLAWHEPLYYVVTAGWAKMGNWLGHSGLNWWEGLQVIISLAFLWLVWLTAKKITQGNRWVAVLSVLLCSVLFVSVKLSAYLTNELAAQTLMLLGAYLWLRWQLIEPGKYRLVLWWSAVLSAATLTKLSAVIVVLAALVLWGVKFLMTRKPYLLGYAAVCLGTLALLNTPWLVYKHRQFGAVFSINLHERAHAQSLVRSQGWSYLFAVNPRIFTTQPFWFGAPQSFASIVLGDTFGDYYNLFANPDAMEKLPASARVQTGNGRFTTPQRWDAMVWANRIGVFIAGLWVVGFFCRIIQMIRRRQTDWNLLWVSVLVAGAWAALAYNVLRFPYLERGVLKAAFIYFSFPLLAIVSFQWWWEQSRFSWVRGVVLVMPGVAYVVAAISMLWV